MKLSLFPFLRSTISALAYSPVEESGAGGSGPAPGSIDAIAASMLVDPTNEGKGAAQSGDPERRKEQSARPAQKPAVPLLEDGQGDQDFQNDDEEEDILDSQDGGEDDDLGRELDAADEGDVYDILDDDADDDRDEDGKDEKVDASKLGDELKLTVTVDGEETEVTLGELKRRYAGEGAIEKRLQTATETRNTAFEDYDKLQNTTKAMLEKFGQALFRRTVNAPSEELRASNPTRYLMHKELYDRETQALAKMQHDLLAVTQEADALHEHNKKEFRRQAAERLFQIMPVFKDPVKGPRMKAALVTAAKEIGYTDAEIAGCTDPLMFKTVALAAKELRRQKAMKATPKEASPRTLGKTGQNRAPVANAKRLETQALNKARKTGSIDDIAASMVVTAKKRR